MKQIILLILIVLFFCQITYAMFCPYCRQENPDDAEFCTKCGKTIGTKTLKQQLTPDGEKLTEEFEVDISSSTLNKEQETDLNISTTTLKKKHKARKESPAEVEPLSLKKTRLGFFACLPTGILASSPLDAQGIASAQGVSYDMTYGFGIMIDYNISKSIGMFFDIGFYNFNVLLVEAGDKGSGWWVFEQTGYSTNETGVFSTDVYYDMQTTGFKFGPKFMFGSKKTKTWFNMGLGLYRWTLNFYNEDKTKTYGYDYGFVTGMTMGIGVDITNKNATLRVYLDMMSPLAYPEIDDLFYTGWTWKNTQGEHIMGPYRIGIGLLF